MADLNPQFQVGLDVADRLCLIVGGDGEAADKGGRLLDAGARVAVVSRGLHPRLQEWARDGALQHRARPFQPGDLDGVFLVVNAQKGEPEVARQVFELAVERGILVNTCDQPALSNFGMVALVRSGHLRLSISTSNASPSLASRLRQDLGEVFGDEFIEYLEQLGRVRAHLKETEPHRNARVAALDSLTAGFRLEGRLHYPQGWRLRVQSLLDRTRSA